MTTETMLYTTLRLAKEANACKASYEAVSKALGKGYGLDTPIPLTRIRELQGLEDALWCLRCVPSEQEAIRDRVTRLFACDCAEHVAHLWVAPPGVTWKPSDTIGVARRYAIGQATQQELVWARAAWAAAWAAAGAAARAAAGAAARAAGAAAWAAAGAAARAAAGAAEAAAWAAAGAAARAAAGAAARAAAGAAEAAAGAAEAAEAAEHTWQVQRFCEYLEGTRREA